MDFWKDESRQFVDPTIFSREAKRRSEQFAEECMKSKNKKQNRRTQIRKFYDEVVRLETRARAKGGEWANVLPLVHMLPAKAAYAQGRGLVSPAFASFIRDAVEQVERVEDLVVFSHFFEAFIGFYRADCPEN